MSSSSLSLPVTKTSTHRRKKLAKFIRENGITMVKSCSFCTREKKVCRVHIKSGRCSECNEHNIKGCDVRVTPAEWKSLQSVRDKLTRELEAVRHDLVRKSEEIAAAYAKEARLRRQLELHEKREGEAIAVEEASIQVLEQGELEAAPPSIPEDWWFPASDPSVFDPSLSLDGNLLLPESFSELVSSSSNQEAAV